MKVLVTGLCLSRNLGGPAMALTLVEKLRERIVDVDFTFAIDPNAGKQEKKWAEYYGLNIVCRDNIVSYLVKTNPLFGLAKRMSGFVKRHTSAAVPDPRDVHRDFMEAYASCDAVIDMQGISYVGDGVRGPLEGLLSYSNLYYANKYKKPFVHFIQSFGPFNDWKVRLFAKRDFDQMDFVPARGRRSAQYCREIVNDPEKVYDFPDCAILLPPASNNWAKKYLIELGFTFKNYVVLSPSSVIYNMKTQAGWSVGDEHVETFALISEKLLSNGENILFLPHMYSDNKSECDREVSRKVLQCMRRRMIDFSRCKIVEDDLDVWQAKTLISMSKAAIVSRYHALVAAISTGIPVITVGWNVKYLDLMEYYGIETMAIDVRGITPLQICQKVIERLIAYRTDSNLMETVIKKQQENAAKVDGAFDMLADWVSKHAR